LKKIAIIPARAGSKRLAGKNKLLFRGRPLVEHTMLVARDAGIFDRILVSSDDAEVLNLARKCSLDVEERKPELGSDTATVSDVCADILERSPGYDFMCCLYATSPLRTSDDIRNSFKLLQESGAASVICTTRYLHPAYQALRPAEGGGWELAFPEWGQKQSQSVPPLRVDNGGCYWVRVQEFLAKRSFYLKPLQTYEMPIERSIDLDTPEDWALLNRLHPE
jgi:CMP-N-acetylneuraminic acid synthetase